MEDACETVIICRDSYVVTIQLILTVSVMESFRSLLSIQRRVDTPREIWRYR